MKRAFLKAGSDGHGFAKMHVIDRKCNAAVIFAAAMIPISDYTYDLPPGRIAFHPLADRDQSKLLIYQRGLIQHTQFRNIAGYLPPNAHLYFNDTKVIPARLFFRKETGAEIEIFLLNPVHPSSLIQEAMAHTGMVQWHCTIGNLKRWSDGSILRSTHGGQVLEARLVNREEGIVEFSGLPNRSFAELVTEFGVTPLPPYIKRQVERADRERYQTVYSHAAGAVAAPTAGLHFTARILEQLRQQNIPTDYLTLHVSAGTFQPVKSVDALDHHMHAEQIVISRANIEHLLDPDQYVIAVGTTAMRTLESVYWFGARLLNDPGSHFQVRQRDPYEYGGIPPTSRQALEAVLHHMQQRKLTQITGETSIYVLPGYSFKICKGLITNFHQPGSTLLLLIAAFVGADWRKIYDEALASDYRFLSYGDSSLLLT